MKNEILSTKEIMCFDAEEVPPPENKIVWCVSKYGVGRKDIFIHGFDIAWFPLPGVPQSAKDRAERVK